MNGLVSYLGSLRLLRLDALDLGEGNVEVGAVLLVAPHNLPQLLLTLFEQVLVQEGAATAVLIYRTLLYSGTTACMHRQWALLYSTPPYKMNKKVLKRHEKN